MTIFTFNATFDYQAWETLLDKEAAYRKRRAEWTGSLLPAVIYVFDHDLDLETATVAQLERKYDQLEQEVNALAKAANEACIRLRPKHPAKSEALARADQRVHELRQLVQRAEAQYNQNAAEYLKEQYPSDTKQAEPTDSPTPSPTENDTDIGTDTDTDDDESTEAFDKSRNVDRELTQRLLKTKRAGKAVKRVFSQVMALTHPSRYPTDEILRELFDGATEARAQNDLTLLNQLLVLALQYHSPDRKLLAMERLKAKRQALAQHAQNLENHKHAVKNSPAFHVHRLETEGKDADALALLGRILDATIEQRNEEARVLRAKLQFFTAD